MHCQGRDCESRILVHELKHHYFGFFRTREPLSCCACHIARHAWMKQADELYSPKTKSGKLKVWSRRKEWLVINILSTRKRKKTNNEILVYANEITFSFQKVTPPFFARLVLTKHGRNWTPLNLKILHFFGTQLQRDSQPQSLYHESTGNVTLHATWHAMAYCHRSREACAAKHDKTVSILFTCGISFENNLYIYSNWQYGLFYVW